MNNRLAVLFRFLMLASVLVMAAGQAMGQEQHAGEDKREQGSFSMAVKTNLLYDAFLLPNAEIEATLGSHWSLMAEVSGVKISKEDEGSFTQILSVGGEVRYWYDCTTAAFTRKEREWAPLNGFFTGIYYNMGLYDLERDYRGCQDSNPWSVGISAGYSFPISRSLRAELSLGVGYFYSSYRHYHQETLPSGNSPLVEHYQSRLNWFGPTKAKISIVWIPPFFHTKAARR